MGSKFVSCVEFGKIWFKYYNIFFCSAKCTLSIGWCKWFCVFENFPIDFNFHPLSFELPNIGTQCCAFWFFMIEVERMTWISVFEGISMIEVELFQIKTKPKTSCFRFRNGSRKQRRLVVDQYWEPFFWWWWCTSFSAFRICPFRMFLTPCLNLVGIWQCGKPPTH